MSVPFKTPEDFRKSLEARLQVIAKKEKKNLQYLRQKVAFDRLLARVFSREPSAFVLKGGYAMELRTAKARATRDIDLTCIRRTRKEEDLIAEIFLKELQELARIDLGDYFIYRIGMPQKDLEKPPYGGARYPVSVSIGDRIFVRFHLDVGGDAITGLIESIKGSDWLGFCGISPPTIAMISIEQQLAEKLHAYSFPTGDRENSRVKDLIDMVLLLGMKKLAGTSFLDTMRVVFDIRDTHPMPSQLISPPDKWRGPYADLALRCGISQDISEGFGLVSGFYEEVIAPIALPSS